MGMLDLSLQHKKSLTESLSGALIISVNTTCVNNTISSLITGATK